MGYDMYTLHGGKYFRAAIGGMSSLRQEMHAQGMLQTDYERPDYPGGEWDMEFKSWHPKPVSGIAVHKFSSNDGWIVTPEEIRIALKMASSEIVKPGHAGGEPTIEVGGAEKTGDALLQMLGAKGAKVVGHSFGQIRDVDPEYWSRWLEYLEEAIEDGGFEVW